MFDALEKNTLNHISVVEDFIDIHQKAGAKRNSKERNAMKVYAVSACVTRLYAIFENFIETAISDYLEEIPILERYSSLHDGMKKEYRLGISYLLSKIDQGRYSHLTHESIIERYHEALTDLQSYKIVTEALVRHETNFRLKTVVNLFNKIQLSGLSEWLMQHEAVKSLYPDDKGKEAYEQLEAEWRNFIRLRNDASHTSLDDLEGEENLLRYCTIAKKLVIAISQYLHKCLLIKKAKVGKARSLGSVTEVFKRNGAFILLLSKGEALSVGDVVHILCRSSCFEKMILSIQIDGSNVNNVIAEDDCCEVGLQFDQPIKKNSALYVSCS